MNILFVRQSVLHTHTHTYTHTHTLGSNERMVAFAPRLFSLTNDIWNVIFIELDPVSWTLPGKEVTGYLSLVNMPGRRGALRG